MTKKHSYTFLIELDEETARRVSAAAIRDGVATDDAIQAALDALRLELALDHRDWLRVEEAGAKLLITVAPGVLDAEASR